MQEEKVSFKIGGEKNDKCTQLGFVEKMPASAPYPTVVFLLHPAHKQSCSLFLLLIRAEIHLKVQVNFKQETL